jgi:putative ABC transport system substrate-binding protein
MGADEVGTVQAMREHRSAADPLIAQHGGRIVKTTGDGVLIEFNSVVGAVECAADDIRAGRQSHDRQVARPYHTFAEAGGLMSYGPNFTAAYRQVAAYAGKILKGAKPADLPVQHAIDPRPRRRGHRMKRREFIAMLGMAAAMSPGARAQQPTKLPRVGILSDETPSLAAKFFEPFVQGLRDLGWAEGQNIAFERRSSEGNDKTFPGLAAELVRLHPDVILAIGTPATAAAKSATQTIPIVFARTADPVAFGLVSTLARPGGNLTGLSLQYLDIAAKRLELLLTAAPDAKRVGALWDSSFLPAGPQLKEVEGAARSLNVELVPADVRGPQDFEPALQAMAEQRASAMIYVPSPPFFAEYSQQLADLLLKARLPSMFPRREFVEAGGLMSYGPNNSDMYRRAAAYVGKILKGAKPADLPVEQPTKFELVINLNTAKALGLILPFTLVARADEVIE